MEEGVHTAALDRMAPRTGWLGCPTLAAVNDEMESVYGLGQETNGTTVDLLSGLKCAV